MATVSVRSISVAILLLVAGGGCSGMPWGSSGSVPLVSRLKQSPSAGTSNGRFAWFKGLTRRRDPALPDFGNDSLSAPPFVAPGTQDKGTFAKMGDAVNNSRLVKSVKGTLKKGTEKISDIGRPAAVSGDPISLDHPISDLNADFYVSIARLQEGKGSVVRAEDQYRKALEVNPRNLKALLGLARLLDRLERLDEATKLYLQATRQHHKEPSPFNDLALCYAKQGKLKESITALTRAIELQPYRKLYRNNIATVLVEAGQHEQALAHLVAVHGGAVAHYNLGFLLNQKGERQPASYHFAKAVQLDPSFTEARQWHELTMAQNGPAVASGPAANPAAGNLVPNPPIGSSHRSGNTALMNRQPVSPGGAMPETGAPYVGRSPASPTQGPALVPPLDSRYSAPPAGTAGHGSVYPNHGQPRPSRGSVNRSQTTPSRETASPAHRPTSTTTPYTPYSSPTQSPLAPRETPTSQQADSIVPPMPDSGLETTPALGVRPFDPPRFPMREGELSAPGVEVPKLPSGATYYPPSRY